MAGGPTIKALLDTAGAVASTRDDLMTALASIAADAATTPPPAAAGTQGKA